MSSFKTPSKASTKAPELAKAAVIFEYSHASANSLLRAFDDAKQKRGNLRGPLTDQELDILRAALLMSCAGLDAAIKQAIRDCIESLLSNYSTVEEGFEKFIRKRLGGEKDIIEASSGMKFLASVLASTQPRKLLLEEYIRELTGDSLQSADEVLRTYGALGLETAAIAKTKKELKEIFDIRNKIVHELDIDLAAKPRKRRVRSQDDLINWCDRILNLTKDMLEHIDRKLVEIDAS